jgi:rod shape-determining protein MreB
MHMTKPNTPALPWLHRLLRGACVYVQISPTLLTLRNCTTGQSISEPPEMALRRSAQITIHAVGSNAQTAVANAQAAGLPPGVTLDLVNPFNHPRTIISDFVIAQQLLKHQLWALLGKGWFKPAPWMVVHPLGIPEGGYTDVEIRALHEMCMGAGASQCVVWQGPPLSDAQVLSRSFPSDGKVLA